MKGLGPLNRSGQLYINTPTAGIGGAVVDNLTFQRNIPLTYLTDENIRGEVVAGRDGEVATDVFRTRWFDGLRAQMFIKSEGHTYRILRLKPLERREGWQIYTQEIT